MSAHSSHDDGTSLHISGFDNDGLERAGLLFPFRTGLPSPEWIVVDNRPGQIAAAGWEVV